MKNTVLITGASGGIGQALVRCFAVAGYQIAIHYHKNRLGAEKARRDALAAGAAALCYEADISSGREARDMAAKAASELGEITHLINNAGFSQQKLFGDISDDEWDRMFAVHVHGAFACSQAVLPAMLRRQQGSIINISSIWGQTGASCEVHYSAAKAALEGMTKALAKELGPSGIRVNALAPGVMDTAMNSGVDKEALDQLASATALGRLGRPEEAARLALFLSGQEASYITGQVFSVNGGF
jgi:3-oxoacyl-[acyl-carrier protein] reductase